MERELRELVKDCQSDLAKYLVPDSGINEKEIISQLLSRLDGPQAREALKQQIYTEWMIPGYGEADE